MKDELGHRIKDQYENRTQFYMPRRTFTIIRLDGKAFHTFTKEFEKPFDLMLYEAFKDSTLRLCNEVQGCVFGYMQSDEVSLLLQDFRNERTNAYFDNNVQKIASVTSSIMTSEFNKELGKILYQNKVNKKDNTTFYLHEVFDKASARFDARTFTIPDIVEVINYFVWRQKDAIRNSISSLAQSLYSHKELEGKSQEEMKDMCFSKGYIWDDLSEEQKMGTVFMKSEGEWIIRGAMNFTLFKDPNIWRNLWNLEIQ